MKTLISISSPISFPQWKKYISNVPSLHHHHHFSNNKNQIFFNFRITRLHKTTSFSSYSTEYNGWVDPSPVNNPTESTHLSKLLTSLGIDDKKYAFVYVFGFLCALAVSRIRVSSIIVFPACFIVFAIGFSFGVVNNCGFVKKKRVKDVKFETLSDLLSGFDVKILGLRDSMRRNIECGKISKKDLVGYAEGLEFVEESVLEVKRLVDGMVVDGNNVSKGKGKGKRFDVLGFINGFRERSFGSRGSKVKDGVKNDLRYKEGSDCDQGNVVDPVVEDEMEKFVTSDADVRVKETYVGKGMGRVVEMETGGKQVFERDERFMNNGNLDDGFLDTDFGASYKNRRRREEFFQQERGNFKQKDENNMLYDNMEPTEEEGYDKSQIENGFASSPSSDISSDIIFSDYITEANALSKQARKLLKHRGIEEDAENMLYKSTELLSKAVDMKPMSLLAVGQLGNTYLLHGELKLKLSRKLRAMLAQSDSNERLHDEVSNREKFVDYLVNVCEECEELLVNAGSKYRLALSIDADDMRALYNWGLALSFRAQLIADIGPEAAFDADKVYLAAIDKFDAMMSKSNAHTPDALFRWGVALQQRSRLRTRNFREKLSCLARQKGFMRMHFSWTQRISRSMGGSTKGSKRDLICTLKSFVVEQADVSQVVVEKGSKRKAKSSSVEGHLEVINTVSVNKSIKRRTKQITTDVNLALETSKDIENCTKVDISEHQVEPWTVLAHKKPQKDWIAYNPKTMRPPPLGSDSKHVKLMSWNVNGLRALLKLESFSALELAQREDFDVLCLQETKLQEKDVESIKQRLLEGYDNSFWTCSVSKLGYSGTAIISRIPPLSVRYGLGIADHDSEGRLITTEFDSFYLISGYVPNSGDGLKRLSYRITEWDTSLSNYVKELEKSKPVILTGDLNCAYEEIDIYNPAGNKRSAGFTIEERNSFEENFLKKGLVDTFRKRHPNVVGYTYWGFRHGGRKTNKGWRLDYFLVSESIADKVHDSYILPDVLGSDHCPIGLVLKL